MSLPRLRVSADRRRIETDSGAPFFWLGDTAWELFHRLRRDEAAHYLATRQRQGFTIIQAVALAELRGLDEPNPYGELPLFDRDPARPNPAYFALVDEYIDLAAAHGLYVALLPTWGDKVARDMWMSENVIFTPQNALAYGGWIGARYRERSNLVWVLGGDRPARHGPHDDRPVWRAMAAGIRAQIPGALMTYHPMGGHRSSRDLHREPWLDLNMFQSGHGSGRDVANWAMVAADHRCRPPKPTLDGEPNYEDHPVSPWPTWDPANGHFSDGDVRRQLYRSIFAGACGATYGNHAVWQFYAPGREPISFVDRPWTEALTRPGAEQMRHLRDLLESRSPVGSAPCQAMIASAHGSGGAHVRALRGAGGSYAWVFVPQAGQSVTVRMRYLAGPTVDAAWLDPRTGARRPIGSFPADGRQRFTAPEDGPDWVLVFDHQ